MDTQMNPIDVVDNLAKSAMTDHDLFAQDDALFDDSLHIKTTVALCALIQNQCLPTSTTFAWDRWPIESANLSKPSW